MGVATFPGKTEFLRITSSLLLEQKITNPFDFLLEGRALQIPVQYDMRELSRLSPFLAAGDAESALELAILIRPFLNGVSAKPSTLDFLTSFNCAIPALFRYVVPCPKRSQGVAP